MNRRIRTLIVILAAALALSLSSGVALAGDVEWPIGLILCTSAAL